MLQELKLEPLEERRCVSTLAFLYKILNEHVAMPPDKLDLVLNDRTVRGTVTQQRFRVPCCRTTVYQKSFVSRTITEWKSLASGREFHNGTLFLMPSCQRLRYLCLEAVDCLGDVTMFLVHALLITVISNGD